MKLKFKQWLIDQDYALIEMLGVDEIVSRIDEQLSICGANDCETAFLEEMIASFIKTLSNDDLVRLLFSYEE